MSQLNLFQRINKVREEVAYIQKDKSVSTGAGSYKAVTHDMVTAQTRASLVKHGVISWPNLVCSRMNEPYQTPGDQKPNKQWRYDATYDFTFANVDDMSQSIVIRIEAHAMDNADKAPGKALSYAKKYALLKLLDIETGEDEESRVPEDFDSSQYTQAMREATTIEKLNEAYSDLQNASKGKIDAHEQKAYASLRNELAKKLKSSEPLSDERFAAAIAAIKAGKTTKDAVKQYALTADQIKQVDEA